MLTRGGLGALSTFGKRYCDPQASRFGYGTQYSGSANVEELHAVLEMSKIGTSLWLSAPFTHNAGGNM